MTISDRQEQIAMAYGRAILKRMDAGSTLAQAVNQAYADINPKDLKHIRLAVVASLVGVDLDDTPILARHRLQATEGGRVDTTKAVTPGDGAPSPEGDDTFNP